MSEKSFPLKYTLSILIAFILLAIFVGYNPINALDLSVSHHIQKFRNNWLDQLMTIASRLGDVTFAFSFMVVAASLFFIFRYKRAAIFVLAISGTSLVTFILKRVFNRARPTQDHVTLLDSYHNNSFPSGHTLSFVVFFGFLIFLMQQIKSIPKYLSNGIKLFSYFMLIAGPLSRIYLGAHWFTDILGGIMIGLLYLQVLTYYYKMP